MWISHRFKTERNWEEIGGKLGREELEGNWGKKLEGNWRISEEIGGNWRKLEETVPKLLPVKWSKFTRSGCAFSEPKERVILPTRSAFLVLCYQYHYSKQWGIGFLQNIMQLLVEVFIFYGKVGRSTWLQSVGYFGTTLCRTLSRTRWLFPDKQFKSERNKKQMNKSDKSL